MQTALRSAAPCAALGRRAARVAAPAAPRRNVARRGAVLCRAEVSRGF